VTLGLSKHTADEPYLVPVAPTTKFDFTESSSYSNLTQVDTVSQQQAERERKRKRKRKRPVSGVSIHQGQLASKTDILPTLPRGILDKWDRITSRESLTQL
jgi:hypothetical protein